MWHVSRSGGSCQGPCGQRDSVPGAACTLGQQSWGPTWLVPSQDPHFNVSLLEAFDGLGNAILQLVFNGRGPQQLKEASAGSGTEAQTKGAPADCPHSSPSTHLQVLFHLIINLVQGLGAVLQQERGLLVLGFPRFVGVLRHVLVGQAQRAQGLLCKGLQQPRP